MTDPDNAMNHMKTESTHEPVEQPQDANARDSVHAAVRGFLMTWCSQWKWARRLIGGRWEEWWADPVTAYVWMHEPEYLTGTNRPGGCAIWERDPKPRRIEIYSANAASEGRRSEA